jgi:hypothetical protein
MGIYLFSITFCRNDKTAKRATFMKYIILFIAAVIIEIASTFYISAVSDRQLLPMVFWAFIGPFLGLPFLAYQIEAKNNRDRLKLALCYGVGYATGAALVNIIT